MVMESIRTTRLHLVPATAELVRAEIEAPDRFFQHLDVEPAADGPSENLRDALPLFYQQLRDAPEDVGWYCWYWILAEKRCLVGGGGFKGPPLSDGTVEIGYETRPGHRRCGYATEAVRALAHWALRRQAVARVIAETRADNAPSIAVLGKLDFERSGTASEPDLVRFEFSGQADPS